MIDCACKEAREGNAITRTNIQREEVEEIDVVYKLKNLTEDIFRFCKSV